MRKPNLSIRTTLLLIFGILNLLIAIQVGTTVYHAWVNHHNAQKLEKSATFSNYLYSAKDALSLERGMAMSIVYAEPSATQSLKKDIMASRADSNGALEQAIAQARRTLTPDMEAAIARILDDESRLNALRERLDSGLKDRHAGRLTDMPSEFFETSTQLINDIDSLNDIYTRPYLLLNQSLVRQLRFGSLISNLTEYASREYAVLGEAIAGSRYLTIAEQQKLLMWQGRIQYGWELSNNIYLSNRWAESVQPYMNDARTKYFSTVEQIKSIFSEPPRIGMKPSYPIDTRRWMELSGTTLISLHNMSNVIFRLNKEYIDKINNDAERDIIMCMIWFGSVLMLTYYCWRVILVRVIRPVNSMVDTLYQATETYRSDLPEADKARDEIGKLQSVLKVFQAGAGQLQMERDRAQAANIAKSEFLANMSHEIRTPMNVVLGLADILKRSSPLTDRQREFISTLHMSAESLLSIINDLLDFSKIETKSFSLEKIPFDLSVLTSEIIVLMSVNAIEKGLTFETDLSAIEGRTYIGDPTRIRQIMTNLCSNAIKFTENGHIALTVGREESDKAGLEHIVLCVKDTGIGIPQEKLDIIFDKFTQADSSISRKYGGTGLGLAIVKAFVEMMDGQITVESIVEQGTMFTVRLPLKTQRGAMTPPPDEAMNTTTNPGRSKRVLLVEDYKPNAMVAATYLDMFGFSYDIVENGHQAVEKVRTTLYDAVLMDVQMPGLDGYQATRAIRSHERQNNGKRVRIIGMTAHALTGDREKCLEAGMDDYLPKPFKPDDLKEKLLAA